MATRTASLKELREVLEKDFIEKVEKRFAYLGTPPKGTDELEKFYENIENALLHTLAKLSQLPQAKKIEVLIEYLKAAKYCGGRIQSVAIKNYDLIVRGKADTLEGRIYEALGDFRHMLLESIVPATEQSVHLYNKYFYLLAEELNLPNKEEAFDDRLAPVVEKEQVKTQFFRLYHAKAVVVDCISTLLTQESDLRDLAIDWLKKHVPAEYEKEKYDAIRKGVQECKPEEQISNLKEQEIYVMKGQAIDEAIESSRQHDYLEHKVIEDMESATMRIRKEAVAFMLEQLEVIQPIGATYSLETSE